MCHPYRHAASMAKNILLFFIWAWFCQRSHGPKRLRVTTLCDLFILYLQCCGESGQHFLHREDSQTQTHTYWLLADPNTTTLFSRGARLFLHCVWQSLSWAISSVCHDNSLILLLEVIKPLPSTSSKLLHIPPLWLSQRHAKSDANVCEHV